jgi:bifunctional non-homologous end joining protein LigD
MKALGVKEIPHGDWLLEIKLDGYRSLAILRGGQAELWSRNRNSLSSEYPEIVAALKKLKCKDAILDGEIVALDETGRPTFQLLQGLGQSAKRPPLFFYVFDLLRLKGKSLLQMPIEERKAALAGLLAAAPAEIKVSPVFHESPTALLKEAKSKGLEGIVAKQAGSLYEPGQRSGAWLKCRLSLEQEFVIGGFTPPGGSRPYFGAILVGYYEGGELMYAGKVGTGFNHKWLASLHEKFLKLATGSCPFANLPMPKKPRFGQGMTMSEMRTVTWLKPRIVAQIHFNEWTRDGMLRQPVFLGLREDKSAKEVVREVSASE